MNHCDPANDGGQKGRVSPQYHLGGVGCPSGDEVWVEREGGRAGGVGAGAALSVLRSLIFSNRFSFSLF